MVRKMSLLAVSSLVFFMPTGREMVAQENPDIHVVVNMVQLNVAVTDKKGNYVTALKPEDFQILKDGIVEKPATFAEGNGPARNLGEVANDGPGNPAKGAAGQGLPGSSPQNLSELVSGANVFILFDTSDYMYRGFVFAQDAIAEFVRSLGNADKVSFYSYSRDLSRAARLTSDRAQILRSVRSTVAGDEAALYNTLLLTLKDAAQYTGRKVVVVFS